MIHTSSRWAAADRRLGLWGFPFIYIGWAYLFWTPILASSESVWSFPNVLFFLVGGASPLLAGITLAGLQGGKQRLREIGWRLADLRRIGPRWLIAILLFWPTFDFVIAGCALVMGITDRLVEIVWDVVTAPRTLAFMFMLSFLFPAVEEIGLRGYWLDELQDRFHPAVAGVINGATWAVWHTPFVWFPGYYAHTNFKPELWWWLPSIVLQTLLIVWVYNGTKRSILAVLLFHGMMNFTGEFLGLSQEMFPFMLVGNALVASALVAAWMGPRTPDSRHTTPPSGSEPPLRSRVQPRGSAAKLQLHSARK